MSGAGERREGREMDTAPTQEPPLETVWLDMEHRVASFHPVEGWQKQSFQVREFFLSYLHALQEQGYRFQ